MIKTLIFDLGGVCFTDGTKFAIEAISQMFTLPKEQVENVLSGELGDQYRRGQIDSETFWEKAEEEWRKSLPSDELQQIWLNGYQKIRGTFELLNRLKD